MERKKTQRDPERIVKLYDWLWHRAAGGKCPPFQRLKPNTLTGRALRQLIPQMLPISEALKSPAYRNAVAKIIHSN